MEITLGYFRNCVMSRKAIKKDMLSRVFLKLGNPACHPSWSSEQGSYSPRFGQSPASYQMRVHFARSQRGRDPTWRSRSLLCVRYPPWPTEGLKASSESHSHPIAWTAKKFLHSIQIPCGGMVTGGGCISFWGGLLNCLGRDGLASP